MARQLSLAQLPKRGRPPRHQYLNRLAASQSSQRETLRKGQSPLLCTGSRYSSISKYTARRFLGYKITVIARVDGVLRTSLIRCSPVENDDQPSFQEALTAGHSQPSVTQTVG